MKTEWLLLLLLMKKLWLWSWFLIVHLVTDIVVNAVNITMNQGEFWPLLIAWGLRRFLKKKESIRVVETDLVMPEARNQGWSPVDRCWFFHRFHSGITRSFLKDGFPMISEASTTVVSVEKIGSYLHSLSPLADPVGFPIPDGWNRFDKRVLPPPPPVFGDVMQREIVSFMFEKVHMKQPNEDESNDFREERSKKKHLEELAIFLKNGAINWVTKKPGLVGLYRGLYYPIIWGFQYANIRIPINQPV